jgi:hypothetical protein
MFEWVARRKARRLRRKVLTDYDAKVCRSVMSLLERPDNMLDNQFPVRLGKKFIGIPAFIEKEFDANSSPEYVGVMITATAFVDHIENSTSSD